jgi:hypothetical protein
MIDFILNYERWIALFFFADDQEVMAKSRLKLEAECSCERSVSYCQTAVYRREQFISSNNNSRSQSVKNETKSHCFLRYKKYIKKYNMFRFNLRPILMKYSTLGSQLIHYPHI